MRIPFKVFLLGEELDSYEAESRLAGLGYARYLGADAVEETNASETIWWSIVLDDDNNTLVWQQMTTQEIEEYREQMEKEVVNV